MNTRSAQTRPALLLLALTALSAVLSLPGLVLWMMLCLLGLLNGVQSALTSGMGWRPVELAGAVLGCWGWWALAASIVHGKTAPLSRWIKAGFVAGCIVQVYLLYYAASPLIYLMFIGPNALMGCALFADFHARRGPLLQGTQKS